jgi:hypothetical protein
LGRFGRKQPIRLYPIPRGCGERNRSYEAQKKLLTKAYTGQKLSREEQREAENIFNSIAEKQTRGYSVAGKLSSNLGSIVKIPLEFYLTGNMLKGAGLLGEVNTIKQLSERLTAKAGDAVMYTILQNPTAVFNAY